MKFKIIAPVALLCFSFSLVGCSGNTTDNNSDTGTNMDTGLDSENEIIYNNSEDGTDTANEEGYNNSSVTGESLSNQINGIFGGYGIDGNNGNSKSNSNNGVNNKSIPNGTNLTNNYSSIYKSYKNDLGYKYGYGDGLDSTINNLMTDTSNRFTSGMKGAENIIGNKNNSMNNNSNKKYSLNNSTMNNSLMS